MSRFPSFGGLILAAGESARMGRDKALLPWPPGQVATSETFLSAAIRSLEPATDFVIVVVGKNEAALAAIAYSNAASIVINPDPGRGQFSSLQVGLREVLNRGRDAAIVTLIDRPPVRAGTVQELREVFESAASMIWAVVPEFEGKHGHPYAVGREMMELFLREPPTGNARDIEHNNVDHIQYLPVNDAFVALNINTPDDYAKLSTPTS